MSNQERIEQIRFEVNALKKLHNRSWSLEHLGQLVLERIEELENER